MSLRHPHTPYCIRVFMWHAPVAVDLSSCHICLCGSLCSVCVDTCGTACGGQQLRDACLCVMPHLSCCRLSCPSLCPSLWVGQQQGKTCCRHSCASPCCCLVCRASAASSVGPDCTPCETPLHEWAVHGQGPRSGTAVPTNMNNCRCNDATLLSCVMSCLLRAQGTAATPAASQ